ncbi:MAG: TolC family protein [Synergistaceae bacterium]|nr:TolC family protein [Synergistaceae bacterium]
MTASALLAALFVGSFFHINLGPEIKAPDPYDIPEAYVITLSDDIGYMKTASEVRPDYAWWTSFGEPVLEKCINEAFSHNRDLESALAKVQQARAVFRESRGNQRPSLGVEIDATRTYTKVGTTDALNEQNLLYGLGAANYEADLWGKLQKATRAAKENILATEAAKNSVRLALASQVAKTYFSLRGTDKQLIVARKTLDTQNKTVALNRILYDNGSISELDLRRSESAAASSAVQVNQLEITLGKYENSLLVLMGREPKEFIARDIPRGLTLEELPVPPAVPLGIPAEMLRSRPDVKTAEQNYRTALANIGTARAGQYPTLSFDGLIGNPGRAVTDPAGLFSGATGWSLAAQVFVPIFNAGKLSARTAQAEAAAQQAWSDYYKTVQTAFEETVNSINTQAKTQEILAILGEQEKAQRRAYELASIRYSDGISSQIDLLDAERELLSVQLQLEGSRADRLNSIVDLYTSLGCGWAWKAHDDLEKRELPKPWINKEKFSE